MEEKTIEVTKRTPGYAHTAFEGTCSDNVTVQDIKDKFYHPYFGGRNARVFDGKWSAVRHDD